MKARGHSCLDVDKNGDLQPVTCHRFCDAGDGCDVWMCDQTGDR